MYTEVGRNVSDFSESRKIVAEKNLVATICPKTFLKVHNFMCYLIFFSLGMFSCPQLLQNTATMRHSQFI